MARFLKYSLAMVAVLAATLTASSSALAYFPGGEQFMSEETLVYYNNVVESYIDPVPAFALPAPAYACPAPCPMPVLPEPVFAQPDCGCGCDMAVAPTFALPSYGYPYYGYSSYGYPNYACGGGCGCGNDFAWDSNFAWDSDFGWGDGWDGWDYGANGLADEIIDETYDNIEESFARAF